MFNLSPIPPTSTTRLAATVPGRDDWCGTPVPTTPATPARTSVIAPWLAASQLATSAQAKLDAAIDALTFDPRTALQVGIPEHNGPDTPDNPWFIGTPPFADAAALASSAITEIARASGMGGLSAQVRAAFDGASSQALAGVRQLTAMTTRPIDGAKVAQQFLEASSLLGVATQLIAAEHGGVVRPPITILPVDPPVTRPPNPQPNWRIQLPSPDSPIQ
ncbi:MAG: hypothetical protein JWM86_1569 [Thermoleophilia bacterium]|nr:hypothetical protein [Thermoleophilia bacterium]